MRAPVLLMSIGIGAVVVAAACGGGGGGGGGTPTGPSSPTVTTITITADGASPRIASVTAGALVRFVNNDSRMHEIFTTPHELHTDCPPINQVGTLAPGQGKNTGPLTAVRICGYHDHMNPDDQRFRGQINVGTNEGPVPDYRTTH
ncbi:MAG: hypothetical protein ACRD26_24190 [Vicinamibacterales bacterium]